MINCNKGNVTLDGPVEQIFAELVIIFISVYESMKDMTDDEFASTLINRAYIIAMKKIDKERNM